MCASRSCCCTCAVMAACVCSRFEQSLGFYLSAIIVITN